VVSTPLKNISQLSQFGLLFPIYRKMKHVPNHQPAIVDLPIENGDFQIVNL
jgi:hypothetical protein